MGMGRNEDQKGGYGDGTRWKRDWQQHGNAIAQVRASFDAHETRMQQLENRMNEAAAQASQAHALQQTFGRLRDELTFRL